MIVDSGIKMLVWKRVFMIGGLVSLVPHLGLSQDIIYNSNSAPNGNNILSQTQSQSVEQPLFPVTQSPLNTDIPSFVSEKGGQPELNLFDLTASIPENSDSQIDSSEINETDLITKTEPNAPLESGRLATQNDSGKNLSEIFCRPLHR